MSTNNFAAKVAKIASEIHKEIKYIRRKYAAYSQKRNNKLKKSDSEKRNKECQKVIIRACKREKINYVNVLKIFGY